MQTSDNQNNIIGVIEVVKPLDIRDILSRMGLAEDFDYTLDGQTLKLVSPKARSKAVRVKAALNANPDSLEFKFMWKEISYDGLIRNPSMYGPEWDQESVNGWGGGYDTEDAALEALAAFKVKYELHYEYILLKVYK